MELFLLIFKLGKMVEFFCYIAKNIFSIDCQKENNFDSLL